MDAIPTKVRALLFVAGRQSPKSQLAEANLRQLLPPGAFEVVDVIENPQRAVEHGIIVTPTTISTMHGNTQIIGTLCNLDATSRILGL